MIPLKLELKNFLSYGDTQVIDFTQGNLICLLGKNGHGKSAILDALTWALWGQARKPSGTGKADESLLKIGQTKLLVLLEFEVNGQNYLIRREFSKLGNKANTFLDFSIFDPLKKDYISLTEKTSRMTESAIEKVVKIDFETFSNSSFLRQGNSNEFSKKNPKERKALLAKILGLGKLDEAQQAANNFLKEKKARLKLITSLHEEKALKVKDKDPLIIKQKDEALLIERTEASLEILRKNKTLLEEKKIKIDIEINDIKKHLEKQKDIELLFVQEKERLFRIASDWRNLTKTLNSLSTLDHNAEAKKPLLEGEVAFLEKQFLEKINLEKEALALEALIATTSHHETTREELKKEILKKDDVLLELEKHEKNLKRNEDLFLQKKVLQEKTQIFMQKAQSALFSKKESLESSSTQKDLGEFCNNCMQKISKSQAEKVISINNGLKKIANHQVNRLIGVVSQLKTQDSLIKKELAELEHLILQDKINTSKKDSLIKEKLRLNEKLQDALLKIGTTEAKDLASKKELYIQKIKELSDTEKSISKKKLELKACIESIETQKSIAAKKKEKALLFERFSEIKSGIRRTATEKKELEKLISNAPAVKAEYLNLKKDWESCVEEIKKFEKDKSLLAQQHNNTTSQILFLDQEELAAKKIEAEIMEIKEEMIDLEILSEAFGKNGIQAFLIEDVIPEIEDYTNKILSLISETQAKVFIEPLKDLKNGTVRESLDIVISDQSGIRDYEMFSGGEAFRIDFALRVGISQVIARRANATLKTLIIDEGFGALDEEGINLMTNCLYKVASLFEKIIVISHLPSLKEIFPVHIIVSKDSCGSKISVEHRG